jgi:DNA-binding transcriptional LysR family regulator
MSITIDLWKLPLFSIMRRISSRRVGSPAYFAHHAKPRTPQDLASHQCINLRLPTAGGLYAWELGKGERDLRVRVEGQLVFNNVRMILRAAVAGFGLACVLEDQAEAHVADGSLVRVLADWCPLFAGYHLYYPSRRQPSAAFALLVDALRYRG